MHMQTLFHVKFKSMYMYILQIKWVQMFLLHVLRTCKPQGFISKFIFCAISKRNIIEIAFRSSGMGYENKFQKNKAYIFRATFKNWTISYLQLVSNTVLKQRKNLSNRRSYLQYREHCNCSCDITIAWFSHFKADASENFCIFIIYTCYKRSRSSYQLIQSFKENRLSCKKIKWVDDQILSLIYF